MDNINDFRKQAHQMVDWIADYYENIEQYPVKSQVQPGEILDELPKSAPMQAESMEAIMKDFNEIIMKGITHWQSPNFHAYFPANSSYPSILAEMLTSAVGAQCMKWETSPAATELEERVMNWLRDLMNLPKSFQGVIQDSASSATLAAIVSAREKITDFNINKKGFVQSKLRVYCSSEAHSSIEKAVKVAGIGSENLVKIQVDSSGRMIPVQLENAIKADLKKDLTPCCVVGALGTTGTVAIDPIEEIGNICREFNIWFHIDAAYAGSALILPELEYLNKGIEFADSFVFNPHKWLFTNFDCSAYYVKDKAALINTFKILPIYLKTNTDDVVNNYCDWGVQLGRRFRALKLWFVMRSFGVEGLRSKLREHLSLTNDFEDWVMKDSDFEILTPRSLNIVCFRYNPNNLHNKKEINELNKQLMDKINASGEIYLTHTKINDIFALRFVIGQTNVQSKHVEQAWHCIKKHANTYRN